MPIEANAEAIAERFQSLADSAAAVAAKAREFIDTRNQHDRAGSTMTPAQKQAFLAMITPHVTAADQSRQSATEAWTAQAPL